MDVITCVQYYIVETCLKFMIQVEDDEEWSTTDDLGEDEDSSRCALTASLTFYFQFL